MYKEIVIARDALKRPVKIAVGDKLMVLVSGQSGSGKSELAKTICLESMRVMRDKFALVVLDPKIVSFLGYDARAEVFTDIAQFKLVLDSLYSEMLRRYQSMRENGTSRFEVSKENPFILLCIEEISAITTDQTLTKAERDYIVARIKSLSSRMRQAGMGLLVVTQSADTTAVPSEVRNNLDIRIAMKCGNQQAANMATGDRAEEAPAQLLNLPGEAYAITNCTQGRFVRCRGILTSEVDEQRTIAQYAGEKPHLTCFDWDSPEYTG